MQNRNTLEIFTSHANQQAVFRMNGQCAYPESFGNPQQIPSSGLPEYKERVYMKNLLQDKINQYKNKVDLLEIRFDERDRLLLKYMNRDFDTPAIGSSSGGCVRAFQDGAWGFTSFNDLNEIDTMIEEAIAQARVISSESFKLPPAEPIVADVLLDLKTNPFHIPIDRKIELLSSYNDIVMSYGGHIQNSFSFYGDTHIKKYFANSEGTLLYQEAADMVFLIYATAVKDGQAQSRIVTNASSKDFEFFYGFEDSIRQRCAEAEELLFAPKVKAGIYPVIADPSLGGVFAHEAFGHTVEADNIMLKPDMMETLKIGKVFGSEQLSIYDTGLEYGSRGSYVYDDEGTPAQKTYLIKNGVLTGHLHSRETAARMNATPTGNARALDYNFPPICRMRTTCIEAGQHTLEDMLADIDEGVLAIDTYGGTGGEMFSFTAGMGRMIRKGKIEEVVRDVKLNGNLFRTMKDIDMIGNSLVIDESAGGCGKGGQFPLPVAEGSPYIRIQNVTMGGE